VDTGIFVKNGMTIVERDGTVNTLANLPVNVPFPSIEAADSPATEFIIAVGPQHIQVVPESREESSESPLSTMHTRELDLAAYPKPESSSRQDETDRVSKDRDTSIARSPLPPNKGRYKIEHIYCCNRTDLEEEFDRLFEEFQEQVPLNLERHVSRGSYGTYLLGPYPT
jgi:hypothetical protein